jgi:hypothetical protein
MSKLTAVLLLISFALISCVGNRALILSKAELVAGDGYQIKNEVKKATTWDSRVLMGSFFYEVRVGNELEITGDKSTSPIDPQTEITIKVLAGAGQLTLDGTIRNAIGEQISPTSTIIAGKGPCAPRFEISGTELKADGRVELSDLPVCVKFKYGKPIDPHQSYIFYMAKYGGNDVVLLLTPNVIELSTH